MIKRILFLIEGPFNQRDYKRFGVETLEKNGFQVEVWGFAPFLHPHMDASIQVPDPIDSPHYRPYDSPERAVKDLLALNESDCVVCLLHYGCRSLFIYKALSRMKAPYCVAQLGTQPPGASGNNRPSLLRKLRGLSSTALLNIALQRLPFRWLGVRPASILMAGGASSFSTCHSPVDAETKILWAHALDYDIYLDEQTKGDEPADSKTGVFIDQYLPFHPDNILLGTPSSTTPEKYFPALEKFFDFLERRWDVKITVAAHPWSQYDAGPRYFGNRPVIKGKTAELVKKSRFIMLHYSTAINFAVLFNKPAVFLTTDSIEAGIAESPSLHALAGSLGKTPIHLDRPFDLDWEKEMSVDPSAYRRYRETYIKKPGTPEKPAWQIFSDFVKTL